MEQASVRTTALAVLVFCGAFAGVATVSAAQQSVPSAETEVPAATVQTDDTVKQTDDSPTIQITTEYRLTPARPGRIEVQWQFDIPDSVGVVNASVLSHAENVRTDGFEQSSGDYYVWDEADQTTETPTITFNAPVNRTQSRNDTEVSTEQYTHVDTGDWALIRRQMPREMYYNYTDVGSEPTVDRRGETTGPGVVGEAMVFLGEYTATERTANSQTFQLVVPEAATLTEDRDDIFGSVMDASDRLRVGDRDERVLMIAAPRGVSWASRGLQLGERDFYTLANQTVDEADNVWVHEYIHTRQDFETTERAEWILEASADYYSGLFTLQQGRIDFQAFREYLDRGTESRWADVRLVEPGTWRGNEGNYVKGRLVSGTLDRELRMATNKSASFQDVFERLNRQDAVSHSRFVDTVETVGNTGIRSFFRTNTETTATPDTWSLSTHERVFGSAPASFSFQFPSVDSGDLQVSGPYGTRTLTDETVVRSESLDIPITVENVGETDGTYNLTVTRNGESIATRSGQLAAGATTTESVTATFSAAGTYQFSTGRDSLVVSVVDPAPLVVTDISAERTSPGSETVRVTATVENRVSWPGTDTIRLEGESTQLAEETLQLGAGETATVSGTTTLADPGTYEFTAGNTTLTLTVTAPDGTATTTESNGQSDTGEETEETPGTDGAGFGVLVGILGVVVALLVANRIE